MPIIGGYAPREQRRLALGLFTYVSVFVLAGLWVGEVLLEVLGISTAALTATGGIALLWEAVPLMLGMHEAEVLEAVGVAEAAPGSAHETVELDPADSRDLPADRRRRDVRRARRFRSDGGQRR